jgi:hypothetical protein
MIDPVSSFPPFIIRSAHIILIYMRQKIKQWLIEEELFREEVADEVSQFRILFTYPEDHFMEIVQPLSKPDMVLVATTTIVNPEHVAIMRKLPSSQRGEFLWAFRCIINNFFIDFELVHENSILERFTLTDIIYEDGLSKDSLMRTIRKVWKANLQAIWILQKEFMGSEPMKSDTEGDFTLYG